MARKKRTLTAEVVDEGGKVNLTGTTRLEFSLNKADIIDYYCADEEEKTEAEISVVAKELSLLDENIESLRSKLFTGEDDDEDYDVHGRRNCPCPPVVEKALLKEYSKAISLTKKTILAAKKAVAAKTYALAAFTKIGSKDPDKDCDDEEEDEEELKVHVMLLSNDPQSRHWGEAILPWKCKVKARKPLKGSRRQLGRNVPDSKLHDLPIAAGFWSEYTTTVTPRDYLTCQIVVSGHRSGLIKQDLTGEFKVRVTELTSKMNSRGKLLKSLHDLLIKHAELPQFKKQIKKQVVGRVLENTDEGKLLLQALKGIRKNSAKLLTDAASGVSE